MTSRSHSVPTVLKGITKTQRYTIGLVNKVPKKNQIEAAPEKDYQEGFEKEKLVLLSFKSSWLAFSSKMEVQRGCTNCTDESNSGEAM